MVIYIAKNWTEVPPSHEDIPGFGESEGAAMRGKGSKSYSIENKTEFINFLFYAVKKGTTQISCLDKALQRSL